MTKESPCQETGLLRNKQDMSEGLERYQTGSKLALVAPPLSDQTS